MGGWSGEPLAAKITLKFTGKLQKLPEYVGVGWVG